MQRYDSNSDCIIDTKDDPNSYPTHAYVRSNGALGPKLSILSQWYNNRRANVAYAIGFSGVMLRDAEAANHAKRYFMEWLTYGVYADGSQGEYARNGNYCVARQGNLYGQINLQTALLFQRDLLRITGDRSLLDFTTTDGLFGSESPAGGAPKSLALLVQTSLDTTNRKINWYYYRPWLATQEYTENTYLGRMTSHYMNSTVPTDNAQETGLILVANLFPNLPIAATVLRDPSVTSVPFPTASGARIATGSTVWSDVQGTVPGALLMRPAERPVVKVAAAPNTVPFRGSTTITWSATDATSCTANGPGLRGAVASSGSYAASNLLISNSYTITCNGLGGSSSGTVAVTVGPLRPGSGSVPVASVR